MNIQEHKEGSVYTIVLEGNLDTSTAPALEERLGNITKDIKEVVFDFSKLDYISSAGLRSMLSVSELVGEDGVICVKGANNMILDIFDTTGFSSLLRYI